MTKPVASWIRFLLVAILLAAAGIFLHSRGDRESLPGRADFASFPQQVGNWVSRDLSLSPEVHEILGDGDFLFRNYERLPQEPFINLFMAYFSTQRTESTIHSPQNCLPGAGWTPIEYSRMQLAIPGRAPFTINHYVIAKGRERQLVLYWYQAHGRVVASEYSAKFYLVADSIRLNRSDGALVRIVTQVSGDELVDHAQRRALEFAQQLTPLLDRYIPL